MDFQFLEISTKVEGLTKFFVYNNENLPQNPIGIVDDPYTTLFNGTIITFENEFGKGIRVSGKKLNFEYHLQETEIPESDVSKYREKYVEKRLVKNDILTRIISTIFDWNIYTNKPIEEYKYFLSYGWVILNEYTDVNYTWINKDYMMLVFD